MTNHLTIIGLGLIGGSLARAFRKFHSEARITAVDVEPVRQFAARQGIADRVLLPSQVQEACTSADIVFLATPIHAAIATLPTIAGVLQEKTIVTDVCSLKAGIVAAAERDLQPQRGVFIGGHPMAGGERPGLQHADPYLFENALYILTPARNAPAEAVEKLAALLRKIGTHIVVLEPETHDRIATAVSHLPQMLAVALMQYVAAKNTDNPLYLKMAAGGFRDMTRIAASPFSVWRDICAGNRDRIIAEIDAFIAALQSVRDLVGSEPLAEVFDSAARNRLSIPRDTRGFLHPHFDLSVEVEDRPGVIATIASTLAAAAINIKDIEVLKVRENEGGTLRLAFASAEKRRQAQTLLTAQGFVCRDRD